MTPDERNKAKRQVALTIVLLLLAVAAILLLQGCMAITPVETQTNIDNVTALVAEIDHKPATEPTHRERQVELSKDAIEHAHVLHDKASGEVTKEMVLGLLEGWLTTLGVPTMLVNKIRNQAAGAIGVAQEKKP